MHLWRILSHERTSNVIARVLRCPGKSGNWCARLAAPANPVWFSGATSTWKGSRRIPLHRQPALGPINTGFIVVVEVHVRGRARLYEGLLILCWSACCGHLTACRERLIKNRRRFARARGKDESAEIFAREKEREFSDDI